MTFWREPVPQRKAAWVTRGVALAVALLGVPAILGISAFLQDAPIRVGEPSPRTVVAPDRIRVPNPEETDRARREAAASVNPVLVDDDVAKAAIVDDVRDVFAVARAVREPVPVDVEEGEEPRSVPPTREEQVEGLTERKPNLSPEAVQTLVELSDSQLDQVSAEAVAVAQQLARQSFGEDRLEQVATRGLQGELAVRSFPEGVAETLVTPVIRQALRPTVTEDPQLTAERRGQARREVQEVFRDFTQGSVIVSAGEVVDELQYNALRQRGLEGAEPWRVLLRALAVTVLLVVVVCAYLRAYRSTVWASSRQLLLLACLFLLFSATLEFVTLLVPDGPWWLFVIPVGAVAMLATILFDPPIGVLVTIPITALVAFTVPTQPEVVAFVALASLSSVPLVSRLSARGDLRRAAWQSTLAYVLLAAACSWVFTGQPDELLPAAGAGLLNGVVTAVIVNGSLPFMESVFGVLTATSLLDLADRNHPLLRELEQKALGSYNHSIMVSTMVERACRAVGADALLGSVAALYHDIGKVRRPYFFVENQFGIANPHDDLEPRVSALIIQEHVTDGIEMARSYRLPPEVVEGIATHHGTTLVSYFYRKAVEASGEDPGEHHGVDEDHFRYKGRKPAGREMAILMLADCCEGASRAAAQHNRNLSNSDLEGIVRGLIADRVEDGQLDESSLTFRELRTVEESFIQTLVGVYHPRIMYPEPPPKKVSATAGHAPGTGDGVRGTGGAADRRDPAGPRGSRARARR
jgi:cyclic-di-AMP phosphodiesterase PgpH